MRLPKAEQLDECLQNGPLTWQSKSEESTQQIGQWLATALPESAVLCLYGDLGAGKTTLMKGLITAATGVSEAEILSPTFTYLNIYEGRRVIYHFDLYRLSDAEEFYHMGFDETFDAGGLTCMEWTERLGVHLPAHYYGLRLEHGETEDQRRVTLWRV